MSILKSLGNMDSRCDVWKPSTYFVWILMATIASGKDISTRNALACLALNRSSSSFRIEDSVFTHEIASPRHHSWECECFRFPSHPSGYLCLPSWLILGTPKAGTSAFWNFLCKDPKHACSPNKEIHEEWGANAVMELAGNSLGKARGNYWSPAASEMKDFILFSSCTKLFYLLRNPISHVYAAWHFWCNEVNDGPACQVGGWVTQTPGALQRTPESFHEVLITYCIVEGMDNYSWSDRWPNSTCPLVWPWKFWEEAIALKHALGPRLFLLRSEELSTFPTATMKKVYQFLQLPLSGYLENIGYFREAYNTGANNGIGETSRLENALGGSYAPMGKPSWLLLRKILRYDKQFPRFLEKTGLRATQKDMKFI